MKSRSDMPVFPAIQPETVTFDCPYFNDGRQTSLELIPVTPATSREFHRLLASGGRRMGDLFYRNVCAACRSCVPLRIETARFVPSKSQRRTIRKNEGITVRERVYGRKDPRITTEKLNLYVKYIRTKHRNDDSMPVNELLHLHHGYPRIRELHFFEAEKLVGVSVLDEASDSLSSNYFYYDTDYLSARLGVFSVLKDIEFAASLGKKYYYLGFYIAELAKMSYKKQFRPGEVLTDAGWTELTDE
jgi:arginine-tRNA-protein transferase